MESEQRHPSTTESTFPFFRNLFGMPAGLAEWFERAEPARALREIDQMRVEEIIEDDALVIRVDLPGIDPEKDVTITVIDRQLRIRAERRQEHEVEEEKFRRAEIRYGAFTRALPLPEGVDAEDVKATYKDGVLTIRLPMPAEAAGVKRIPVERN